MDDKHKWMITRGTTIDYGNPHSCFTENDLSTTLLARSLPRPSWLSMFGPGIILDQLDTNG